MGDVDICKCNHHKLAHNGIGACDRVGCFCAKFKSAECKIYLISEKSK